MQGIEIMEIIKLQGLDQLLAQPQNIFITTHVKPDGDAIGSTMGLYHYLIQKGHRVQVVVPTAVPDFLIWMPEAHHILNYEEDPGAVVDALNQANLIFCLDFNRMDRNGPLGEWVGKSKEKKVLIDHHLEPDVANFDFIFSSPEKSSTAEMVYDFVKMMGDLDLLNMEMMQCIYTGMMTDTGSFRFPSTSASVHLIIASFLEKGLKQAPIHEAVMDNWSVNRMKFMGYLFDQKLITNIDEGYAYIYISKEDLARYELGINDTEGLVNMITSIRGVRLGVLILERDKILKLSLRSKGNIDVQKFASTYFKGGGHFNAAGAISDKNWEETEAILLKRFPEFITPILN